MQLKYNNFEIYIKNNIRIKKIIVIKKIWLLKKRDITIKKRFMHIFNKIKYNSKFYNFIFYNHKTLLYIIRLNIILKYFKN